MLKYYIIFKSECIDTVIMQKFLISLPVLLRFTHVVMVISIKFNG